MDLIQLLHGQYKAKAAHVLCSENMSVVLCLLEAMSGWSV